MSATGFRGSWCRDRLTPAKNWNLGYDPEAFAAVCGSGVPLQFVESGPAAVKPETWRNGNEPPGQRTSIGEGLLARLLGDSAFRQHYTQGVFAQFTDELLLIACVDDDLFETVANASGNGTFLRPKDRDGIASTFTRLFWRAGRPRTGSYSQAVHCQTPSFSRRAHP